MGGRCCRCRKKTEEDDDFIPKEHEGKEVEPRAGVRHGSGVFRWSSHSDVKLDVEKKKKVDMGPKPPAEKLEMADDAAKVHLYVRCENLRKQCRCLVAVYSKLAEETEWCEIGNSELSQEARFPNFGFDVTIPFRSYTVQLVRFEVYRVKHEMDLHVLRDHQFLGCAEINIIDAVKARCQGEGNGEGWCVRKLLNPRPNAPFQGKIAIWAEEDASSKSIMNFDVRAEKLRKTDFWKPRTDPFLTVNRADPKKMIDPSEIEGYKGDVDLNLVYRTETHRRTRKPTFKRISVSVQALCECKGKQKVVFDMWDWFRIGVPRLIGTGLSSYDDIYKNFVDNKPVYVEICRRKEMPTNMPFTVGHLEAYNPDKDHGRLIIEGVEVLRTYTFLDFMRSGTEIVPIFAIDFTRSTGLRDAGVAAGHPLHPLPSEGQNDYIEAMKALGSVMQNFNSKHKFPCYGFGAKVPPTTTVCSHAFAINGDFFSPEVEGIDKVLELYQDCLQVARLHGPTHLHPILELARKWAEPYAEAKTVNDNNVDMKYFVLVLLTDGGVVDQQKAVNAILEMTGLPISVIIIEIGDGKDPFLENIDAEVKANQALHPDEPVRDFIHIVRFNDFRGNPRALNHRTLYSIADEVSAYFASVDVQPRDLLKYEDDRGNPLPRSKVESGPPDPEMEAEARKAAGMETPEDKKEGVDLLDAMKDADKEYEEAISRLPPFLQDKRMEILDSAQSLGYSKSVAWRVMKEGLADSSLDCLVDNILHTGPNKCPTFKDAMQEVRKIRHEMEAKAQAQAKSRQTTKDGESRAATKDGAKSDSSHRASNLEPIKDEMEAGSRSASKEQVVGSKELPDRQVQSRGSVGTVSKDGSDARMMRSSKEVSFHGSPTPSKDVPDRKSALRLKGSTKDTVISMQSDMTMESRPSVGFAMDREVYGSKDPPSSGGGSDSGHVERIPSSGNVRVGTASSAASSALRRKGSSTKDTVLSFKSDGSGSRHSEPRVTLPGAVEYYDAEPADRPTTPAVTKCTICLERKINVEFTPCGHRLACDQCADTIGQTCPLCRTPIRGRKSVS